MKPGMTELDAYLVVQNAAMKELGERVDRLRRLRLRTSDRGPTREVPPSSRVIEAGDLLLL